MLESKNYILDSHLPYLGNFFLFPGEASVTLWEILCSYWRSKVNLNNRNLTDLCYFRKVTEILIKLYDSFPEIILVYGEYLSGICIGIFFLLSQKWCIWNI